MKREKKIQTNPAPEASTRKYTAAEGCLLPIRYDGKIIRIRPGEVTELVIEKIPYESRKHIQDALAVNHIKEVTE